MACVARSTAAVIWTAVRMRPHEAHSADDVGIECMLVGSVGLLEADHRQVTTRGPPARPIGRSGETGERRSEPGGSGAIIEEVWACSPRGRAGSEPGNVTRNPEKSERGSLLLTDITVCRFCPDSVER